MIKKVKKNPVLILTIKFPVVTQGIMAAKSKAQDAQSLMVCLFLLVEARLDGDYSDVELLHLLAQAVREGDARFLRHRVRGEGWKGEPPWRGNNNGS